MVRIGVAAVFLAVGSVPLRADLQIPPRVLDPRGIEEAWNVIRLVIANVDQLLAESRAPEVADQISICSPALRLIARTPTAGMPQALRDEQTARAFRSVNLIARDAQSDNLDGARAVVASLKSALAKLAEGTEPKIVEAEIFACLNHPDIVSTQADAICEKCQRRLIARRIPYSFVYVKPDQPVATLRLLEAASGSATVRLENPEGRPMLPQDLVTSHTQPLHFLVADAALEHLELIRPEVLEVPGEYRCKWVPEGIVAQRIWAAVIPAETGLEEFPYVDLNADAAAPATPPARPDQLVAEVGGYRFQLAPEVGRVGGGAFQAGRLQLMRLVVTAAADGKPIQELEPLLNAFAHLVVVHEDRETLAIFHPTGGDVLRADLRAGPQLSFKVFWPKAGVVRLFCIVSIQGKVYSVPFQLTVTKPQP